MARLYTTLFFVLLVLMVPVESAAATGDLAKLSEIRIVIEHMGSNEKELGLNENDIKNHVFVFLRSKLPTLKVTESVVVPYVYINLNIAKYRTGSGAILGYVGSVRVHIERQVTIDKIGKLTAAPVWINSTLVSGLQDKAVAHVRESLDDLLTAFAADWYRDNP